MADKIERPGLDARQSRNGGGPDGYGFLATRGSLFFFALGGFFTEIEANCANIGTEVKWLDQEPVGIRRHGNQALASVAPKLFRKLGDCLRTSSQSKKASGVSNHTLNHCSTSSFSARLSASTL